MRMRKLILVALIAAGPTLPLAQEGTNMPERLRATYSYDCNVTTSCAQDGMCAAASEAVSFKLTEVDTHIHGEGTYQISYLGLSTEARMDNPYGPYMWVNESDEIINTLQFIGGKEDRAKLTYYATWTQASAYGHAPSTVKFLTCVD
jgi:hypothetical protein